MPAAIRSEYQALLRAIADLPPLPKREPKAQTFQLKAEEETILDALMEHGPSISIELAEWTGMPTRGMSKHLGRLALHGLIIGEPSGTHGPGRTEWTITDEGRQAAITPNPEVWQAKGA